MIKHWTVFTNNVHFLLKPTLLFLLWRFVPLACLYPVSDCLTGKDSLLGCDLLSHTSHGNQSVSTLPSSSCSSVPPGSGSGSCLEELTPCQRTSGKMSTHYAALISWPYVCWVFGPMKPFQTTDAYKNQEGLFRLGKQQFFLYWNEMTDIQWQLHRLICSRANSHLKCMAFKYCDIPGSIYF